MKQNKVRLRAALLASVSAAAAASTTVLIAPRADADGNDIAEVIGASGHPIPGPANVFNAYQVYLNNQDVNTVDPQEYPSLTFPGSEPGGDCSAITVASCGSGLYTPESLYPGEGPHALYLNYPQSPFFGYQIVNGQVSPSLTPLTDPATGKPLLMPNVLAPGETSGEPVTTPGGQTPSGAPVPVTSGDTTSAGQGLTILNNTILSNYENHDTSTVFGYSQSSTISGLEMKVLEAEGMPLRFSDGQPTVNFLLVADPSNPNGGLLERFNGFETQSGNTTVEPLTLPSLGITFDGATPSDLYPADVYTMEYDGFADFPRYPLNFLADLNAVAGIALYHGGYFDTLTPTYLPANETVPAHFAGNPLANLTPFDPDAASPCMGSAACVDFSPGTVLLPAGSADSGNTDSLTNYHMILENHLPLLYPFFEHGPSAEAALADLIEPALKVVVNLGYGADDLGYSSTSAAAPTPFGLFPDISPATVFDRLLDAAQQGWSQFDSDWKSGYFDAHYAAYDPTAPTELTNLPTLAEFANFLSTAGSAINGTLMPSADFLNAFSTALPAYDATLFFDNVASGDYLDAIGLPVAATTGALTVSLGLEIENFMQAGQVIQSAYETLFS